MNGTPTDVLHNQVLRFVTCEPDVASALQKLESYAV